MQRDEEISLVDMWLVVRRRWVWVLASLLLGLFAAIAYITLTTPIYESRASVLIGRVADVGRVEDFSALAVEDFNALAVRLINQYGAGSSGDAEQRMPRLKQATEEPGRNNILRLVTVGHSPEEATEFLSQIISNLMQRHEQIYRKAIDPLQRQLAAVDRQAALLAAQSMQLGELVGRLKESHPVQASLVGIERGRVQAELNELERYRVVLQQKTVQPHSRQTEVVAQAGIPRTPAAPRTVIALAIGIVFGLLLGLLAILLIEFAAKVQAVHRLERR